MRLDKQLHWRLLSMLTAAVVCIDRAACIFLAAGLTIWQKASSPLVGPQCRFAPSCSCYAQTALMRFGALRGTWLALKRLGRCNSLFEGGFDPVPDNPDRIKSELVHG